MAKNGHNAKAIAHAKYITLGQKLKLPKNMQKTFLQVTLQLFYAKNGSKKQLIFEK